MFMRGFKLESGILCRLAWVNFRLGVGLFWLLLILCLCEFCRLCYCAGLTSCGPGLHVGWFCFLGLCLLIDGLYICFFTWAVHSTWVFKFRLCSYKKRFYDQVPVFFKFLDNNWDLIIDQSKFIILKNNYNNIEKNIVFF